MTLSVRVGNAVDPAAEYGLGPASNNEEESTGSPRDKSWSTREANCPRSGKFGLSDSADLDETADSSLRLLAGSNMGAYTYMRSTECASSEASNVRLQVREVCHKQSGGVGRLKRLPALFQQVRCLNCPYGRFGGRDDCHRHSGVGPSFRASRFGVTF